ncbi:MAG: orotidine-5-phosphate decarboxylase [Actinomycetota bacterium]
MKAPIALALDAPNLQKVQEWATAAAPAVDVLKIGLEVFLRDGQAAIDVVKQTDCKLFLDLKLHDIPNTVKGASESVARFNPDFLTVHASGGPAMIAAAASALPNTKITAVTILTSMSPSDLTAVGFEKSAQELAVRMAKMAVEAGARAIVCSPHEVSAIRAAVPNDITLITPGVRPIGADVADQSRVATPQEAIANGANIVVIGRPITGAEDIHKAAMEIAASL